MTNHRPAVVGLTAVALLLAGCGSSHSHSATPADTVPVTNSSALTVTPASPATTDPITFSFTAPVASGAQGKSRISYSVSITGPAGDNCSGAHEASIPQVGKGGTASVTVGPTELGNPWCAGGYSARAFELESAVCTGSAPCPQFFRVVEIVARASYSVHGG